MVGITLMTCLTQLHISQFKGYQAFHRHWDSRWLVQTRVVPGAKSERYFLSKRAEEVGTKCMVGNSEIFLIPEKKLAMSNPSTTPRREDPQA